MFRQQPQQPSSTSFESIVAESSAVAATTTTIPAANTDLSTQFLLDSVSRVVKMYSSHLSPLTDQLTNQNELEKIYRDLTIANTSIFNIVELLSRNAIDIEKCAQDKTIWHEYSNCTKIQILEAYQSLCSLPSSQRDARIYNTLVQFIEAKCEKMLFVKALEMILEQWKVVTRAGSTPENFEQFLARLSRHYLIARLDEPIYQNQTVKEYLYAAMNMLFESVQRLNHVGSRHYASVQNIVLPLVVKFFDKFEVNEGSNNISNSNNSNCNGNQDE